MQRMFRTFCTRFPGSCLFIALHKLLSTLLKEIDVNFMAEVFIRKFIDDVCFPYLPCPIDLKGAMAGSGFPFQKLAVNFSFQIHIVAPFLNPWFYYIKLCAAHTAEKQRRVQIYLSLRFFGHHAGEVLIGTSLDQGFP